MIKDIIKKVVDKQNLTLEEAKTAMDQILGGGATHAQISAYLTALRMKGETIDEITGSAIKLGEKACHIAPNINGYIDCVGTGGDCTNTFNISTTAAFVIAGAGVPVAKHGNRAISSKSGSADVLEALGIKIDLEPEQVTTCLEKIGIGFMNARTFHKSMKMVSEVRADLSMRTIFNILGPLSNPSQAKFQVIGVYDRSLTNPLANAMKNTGIISGMVVSGFSDGMDEISTTGETAVSEIKDGQITDYIITPEQFGIPRASLCDIQGGTAKENAKITLSILNGETGPRRDIAALNAAAAIYCAGKAGSIHEGLELAYKSIDSKNALSKLNEFIKLSGELS